MFRMNRTRIAAAIFTAASLSWASQSIIDGIQAPMGGELAPVFALEGSENRLCTGVLVAPTLIMTAAHCVDGRMSIRTVANGTDLSRNSRRGIVARVKTMKSHPQYVEGSGVSIAAGARWDIGYIVLRAPVTTVTPMRVKTFSTLDEVSILTGKLATTTGYGFSTFRPNGEYDSWDMGIKRYGEKSITQANLDFIAFDSMRYAVLPGDSGGPLLWDDGSGKAVVGINHSMVRDGSSYKYATMHTLRPDSVCWVEKSSGIDIPGVDCQ